MTGIAHRLVARYREAADAILIHGSNPWEIDEAMVKFGFDRGPYEASDLYGLDKICADRRALLEQGKASELNALVLQRMVQEGRLGKKVGVGWYRYPGGSGKVEDPLIEDLIIEEAYFAKVERRTFSDREIQKYLIEAMIDEANAMLNDGTAKTANEIDKAFQASPDFAGQQIGLFDIARKLALEKQTAKGRR